MSWRFNLPSLGWSRVWLTFSMVLVWFAPGLSQAQESWRKLPMIKDGKLDPAWIFLGYGAMSVEDGTLRTDADARGLGLAVYSAEKFGQCELRIVYRTKEAKSNSGVYIRIDDGILKQAGKNHAPGERSSDGQLTPASIEVFKKASAESIGPWYAVHHGFEVQICEEADRFHRSGSIYSLASAEAAPAGDAEKWREMIVRLDGTQVTVSIDGTRVSTFDSSNKNTPERKQWYEPLRDPVRPEAGYIGLQTHDPGDVVYFKEVSVRPLKP